MLMELLGSPQPQPPPRTSRPRILGKTVTQIDTYVQLGAHRATAITAYRERRLHLIGGLPGLHGWADRSCSRERIKSGSAATVEDWQ